MLASELCGDFRCRTMDHGNEKNSKFLKIYYEKVDLWDCIWTIIYKQNKRYRQK